MDVVAEFGEVDAGEVAPGGDECLGADRGRGEWHDWCDRKPGVCDGERLAGLDTRDDLAAAVAQLSDARLWLFHPRRLATCLTCATKFHRVLEDSRCRRRSVRR